jgi:hypothetical protein
MLPMELGTLVMERKMLLWIKGHAEHLASARDLEILRGQMCGCRVVMRSPNSGERALRL